MTETTWTIAYRRPRANRFVRVSTWSGSWAQAVGLARLFAEANPDLQVYYVPTRDAELAGRVAVEDVANVLVDSGRRVRIADVAVELPLSMTERIPAADVAVERWSAGQTIADPEPTEAELVERERLLAEGAAIRDANETEQIEAWWARHGLSERTGENIGDRILAAVDADRAEAEAINDTRGPVEPSLLQVCQRIAAESGGAFREVEPRPATERGPRQLGRFLRINGRVIA